MRLAGGAPRGVQSSRLTLSLNGEKQDVDKGELSAMADAAANVAGVYEALCNDIVEDTFKVPGFDHAVKLTQLLDDVFDSSRTGVRKQAANWVER